MTHRKATYSTKAFMALVVLFAIVLGAMMPSSSAARSDRYQIRNDCLLKEARQNYPKDNGIRIMCNMKTSRFDGSFYMTSNGSAHSSTDSQIKACGSPCPPPRK